MNDNVRKILNEGIEEIINNELNEKELKEKIYKDMKYQKKQKLKKQLLYLYGETPIMFLMLLSSLSLTINSINYFILPSLEKTMSFYTLIIICSSVLFFCLFIYFMIFALLIFKELELSKFKDNIKR